MPAARLLVPPPASAKVSPVRRRKRPADLGETLMKIAFRTALLCTAITLCASTVFAQQITESSPLFTRQDNFFKLPDGRHMGSTNTIAGDSKGNLWVAERCGANSCDKSPLDPIMEFDSQGNFIKSFGAGKVLFPHSIY